MSTEILHSEKEKLFVDFSGYTSALTEEIQPVFEYLLEKSENIGFLGIIIRVIRSPKSLIDIKFGTNYGNSFMDVFLKKGLLVKTGEEEVYFVCKSLEKYIFIFESIARNLIVSKEQIKVPNKQLKTQLEPVGPEEKVVGQSRAWAGVVSRANAVAKFYNVNVLLTGESGVGKDLIAQEIHFSSERKDKPFVSINCSAIPDTLLESEIFGHEKGSFTGAIITKRGKLEVANGGTLFLDEVGEMSITSQCKLLRVLQGEPFERVGGVKSIRVDVRIIAATNADLRQKIKEGKFRLDLFYRLNQFSIHIPPLRERTDDIPIIFEHYLEVLCQKYGKPRPQIDQDLALPMKTYSWPGNVREIQNSLITALVNRNGQEGNLTLAEFPNLYDDALKPVESGLSADTFKSSVEKAKELVEKQLILKILKETNWNRKGAAKKAGISYKTLLNKIKRWGWNNKVIIEIEEP